jgi:hypothetical protein
MLPFLLSYKPHSNYYDVGVEYPVSGQKQGNFVLPAAQVGQK